MEQPESTIRAEIAREGIISVARFMELALYLPEHGYYRRCHTRFGRSGDFYTAEQLQPVFGDLIAAYVSKTAHAQGDDGSFSVLEIGSGLSDLREALEPWSYAGFDWAGDELPDAMNGVIIANEFFDALPVHLIARHNGSWHELGVRVRDGRLALGLMPSLAAQLIEYLNCYGLDAPEGGRIEVCMEAAKWMQTIARLHQSGTLLIIDYGYSARELPRFPDGTLISYRRHQASPDFLSHPGERDITAHVNFSYLRDLALQCGYQVKAAVTLRRWMQEIWNEEELAAVWSSRDGRWRLKWKQLFAEMGETFRVLELSKPRVQKAEQTHEKQKAPGD